MCHTIIPMQLVFKKYVYIKLQNQGNYNLKYVTTFYNNNAFMV